MFLWNFEWSCTGFLAEEAAAAGLDAAVAIAHGADIAVDVGMRSSAPWSCFRAGLAQSCNIVLPATGMEAAGADWACTAPDRAIEAAKIAVERVWIVVMA